LELNLSDPIHIELVQAAANIFATIFKIPLNRSAAHVAEIATQVKLHPFVPKANVKIEVDDKKGDSSMEEQVVFNDEDEN
jgi:hypothetical protein